MSKTMKSCIVCKHLSFDPGEEGYSEVTPGHPMFLECTKGHWAAEEFMNTNYLRLGLTSAESCPDLEEIDLNALRQRVFGNKP